MDEPRRRRLAGWVLIGLAVVLLLGTFALAFMIYALISFALAVPVLISGARLLRT